MNHTASRDTFSHTCISHTPTHTHTHLRKRQATLGICGFVLISEIIVGQHFWIKCLTYEYHANTNSYIDCQTATFLFFFHYAFLSSTGHRRWFVIHTINVSVWILLYWLTAMNTCHVFSFSPLFLPLPLSCSAPTTGGEYIHFHFCGGAGCKAVISDCACERRGRRGA